MFSSTRRVRMIAGAVIALLCRSYLTAQSFPTALSTDFRKLFVLNESCLARGVHLVKTRRSGA
jgi:hypothetical protein